MFSLNIALLTITYYTSYMSDDNNMCHVTTSPPSIHFHRIIPWLHMCSNPLTFYHTGSFGLSCAHICTVYMCILVCIYSYSCIHVYTQVYSRAQVCTDVYTEYGNTPSIISNPKRFSECQIEIAVCVFFYCFSFEICGLI